MLSREDKEELYRSVRKMIESLAQNTAQRTGLDPDECSSEANLYFLKACESYDWKRGARTFPSWCHYVVSHMLLSHVRQKARRGREERLSDVREPVCGFRLPWLSLISVDAQEVVQSITDPPLDVIMDAPTWDHAPARLGNAVRRYLKAVGWDQERIDRAFGEIKECLEC